MSRWVIIAGIATILISLVALASLSGGTSQTTTDEALQEAAEPETDEPEAPDAQEPLTTPTTTPEATPEATPSTTPEQDTEPDQTTQDGQPIQGIRENSQQATGPVPRVATIEIAGDASYSCSIGRIDSPRMVRGANPASFQVRVAPGGSSIDTVMAVCQKITGESLGVGIIYDEEVKVQEDTTGRFGTVSVSWSPVQE